MDVYDKIDSLLASLVEAYATCHREGCVNQDQPILVEVPTTNANVICVCDNRITDIQFKEVSQ